MKLQAKEDLQKLIDEKIEESGELEYKDARALGDSDHQKNEIAKDVSAMVNATGGIIIYGIKESGHVPINIAPVDRNNFSKERLESIINSNISPKIEGLKIISISLENKDEVAYIVEVPQGDTAHQNTRDHKYYRRYNFEAVPMLDYEIRDVMNKKHPIIELDFEIERIGGYELKFLGEEPGLYLKVRPYNKGNSYAKFINYFVELPKGIVSKRQSVKKISENSVEYYGENVVDESFDPVLPGLYGRSERILLDSPFKFDETEIKWRVHADNAPVQHGTIALNKIKK